VVVAPAAQPAQAAAAVVAAAASGGPPAVWRRAAPPAAPGLKAGPCNHAPRQQHREDQQAHDDLGQLLHSSQLKLCKMGSSNHVIQCSLTSATFFPNQASKPSSPVVSLGAKA
jgi:hypothetical protein